MTESITLPTIYPRDKHNISRRQIDPDALKIMYRLMRHGFKAYLVGGGVRDLMLGIKPKDFDIGTDARPRQIKSIFRNCRIIGRRFKLVHVYFQGNKIIELATFRAKDSVPEVAEGEPNNGSSENGALNENVYGTDQTDAFRRDLTINGLFYDLSTFSVIDYVGGVKDLENRIIRVIGDPNIRFAEDPVRLIRTIRHAARTGFTIEEGTYSSLVRNKELLRKASDVRLYEELKKDLVSGHAFAILKLLLSTGLIEYLLPEFLENNGEFLSPENHSSEIYTRADSLIKNGLSITTTSIFAAQVLFSGMPNILRQDLSSRFGSKKELLDHLGNCFPKLSVPRKERERIQVILASWHDLVTSHSETIRVTKFRNKEFLPDLIGLCRLVGESKRDHQLVEVLESIDGTIDGEEETTPKRKRGRRRGGRQLKRFM